MIRPRRLTSSLLTLYCAIGVMLGGPAQANSLYPPVLRNGLGQFILLEPRALAPQTQLRAFDGSVAKMANFAGKIVLLNFWASWCRPCVEEMPSLEALAASLPPDQFVVVAVALDEDDGQKVRAFVARYRLKHLTVLLDPHRKFGVMAADAPPAGAMPVHGLPTSYIVDRAGGITGYLIGPMAWDSSQARSFINYFIGLN